MKRTPIDWRDYAPILAKGLPGGLLLTARAGDKTNSMTIGWGTLGINWSRPVFAVYVRDSRFTKTLLDQNPEFTVNAALTAPDKNALAVCGTKSGRDVDKLALAGLTPVPGVHVSVPGLREFPLTLECRVIYSQREDLSRLDEEIVGRYYPGAQDLHTVYYGQIVDAYLLED